MITKINSFVTCSGTLDNGKPWATIWAYCTGYLDEKSENPVTAFATKVSPYSAEISDKGAVVPGDCLPVQRKFIPFYDEKGRICGGKLV